MGETRPRILIVDDDNDFLEIFSAKLQAEGFEVYQSDNGQSGIDRAKETLPNLILLDVKMPIMGGLETLKKIKADRQLAALPVIFLTSLGEAEEDNRWVDEKFAQELGALGFIKKSDDLDKIVARVREIFNTVNQQ